MFRRLGPDLGKDDIAHLINVCKRQVYLSYNPEVLLASIINMTRMMYHELIFDANAYPVFG
jgi:hypothetical protein